MSIVKYYARDSAAGLIRNAGASAAAVLLILISLSVTGAAYLFKSGVDDTLRYLDSQARIKLFMEPSADAGEIAALLESKAFVRSAEVETGEQTLSKLKGLFAGKEHLFEAFREGDFPDAIVVDFADQSQAALAVEELERVPGIADVIYAQRFAESVQIWSEAAKRYGGGGLAIMAAVTCLTVNIAVNLSLYRRQQEIRVKLLLGAKESHVRGQFWLEGAILGVLGGLLSCLAIYFLYDLVLYRIQLQFSYVFTLRASLLYATMTGLVLGGACIGLAGGYFSTRRLIKHA